MKIVIASDHAGFELKETIIKHIVNKAINTVEDFGPYSDDRVDYPDFAHKLSSAVENNDFDLGILICGSGNGISIAANKHKGIRAALCWNEELATLSRQHNNANVLSLPARFIEVDIAIKCVDAFLSAEFEGGRHQLRVDKICI
jgi:ribose 5-phosphate isomerase B